MAGNHKPVIKGTDLAIWRRIRLIPFTVTIPPDEQDRHLPDKLRAELPGILAWAVRGCLDWQREGLTAPAEVLAATEAYRVEMDTLGDFLAECCTEGPNTQVTAKALYESYTTWAASQGEHSLTQRAFGMRLAERGFDRVRRHGGTWNWIGVGVPA